MAFLRSVFISAFVAYLIASAFYALVELLRGMEPAWSWAGLLLASGAPAGFFAWVFLTRPARTAAHPLGISIASGLGLAITMATSWRYADAAGIIHIWAGAALVSWVLFLRWYSPFSNRNALALEAGKQLPAFELQDVDGAPVSSSSFLGQTHILVFYRGNWCPYCTAQVAEMAQHYRELEAAGARVLMISPQPAAKNRALAGRFDVPMVFLTDLQSEAAKKLGIFNEWGTPFGLQALGYDPDTVLPTVIISDVSGRIIFSHQTDNYRIRPEPSVFLDILAKHQA